MLDSTSPVRTSTSRPRPVVWYGAFTAALGAFLGFAGLADLMPKTVIAWIALVGAVVTAAGAVLVQSTVTPLADPRTADGVSLISTDLAKEQRAKAVAVAVATASGVPVGDVLPPTSGTFGSAAQVTFGTTSPGRDFTPDE